MSSRLPTSNATCPVPMRPCPLQYGEGYHGPFGRSVTDFTVGHNVIAISTGSRFNLIGHCLAVLACRAHAIALLRSMCGRVIQSSGPLRLGIVESLDTRDSRVHNFSLRWNAAPSQDLLVIRRNHETGRVMLEPLRWGLIPYWCQDPKGGRKPINAKCETVARLKAFRDA